MSIVKSPILIREQRKLFNSSIQIFFTRLRIIREENIRLFIRFFWYFKFCLQKRDENIFSGNYALSDLTIRNPLCTVVPQFFAMPVHSISRKITTFLCSSLIQSVQSLEVDDNCIFVEILAKGTEGFSLATRLTHLRIALWHLFHCIDLLNHIGS